MTDGKGRQAVRIRIVRRDVDVVDFEDEGVVVRVVGDD